jgi:hypothetical protein
MSDLRLRRCPISEKVKNKWGKLEKGAGYDPWRLWSDPYGVLRLWG